MSTPSIDAVVKGGKSYPVQAPPDHADTSTDDHLDGLGRRALLKALWSPNTELVTVTVPHVDSSKKSKKFHLPAAWKEYDLDPVYTGSAVYLNAQNHDFYRQDLPSPTLRVWLLIKNNNNFATGYCKKRLIEEGLRRNIQIRLVNPARFDLSLMGDGGRSVAYYGKRLTLPDAVIARTGAASDYFTLAVLRHLEGLGVRVFNGAHGVQISRDKLYSAQLLAAKRIPLPKTILAPYPFDIRSIGKKLGYPMIIKNVSGARGEAVWKVDSINEAKQLLETLIDAQKEVSKHLEEAATSLAATEDQSADASRDAAGASSSSQHWFRELAGSDRLHGSARRASAFGAHEASAAVGEELMKRAKDAYMREPFVFQEFLAYTKGRDLRAFVCGQTVVACMMRSSAAGNFKANVHQGGSVLPVEVGESLRSLAVRTTNICELDISGVDLMMDKDSYKVCEVNSSPGFEGLERATGIDVARAILDHVQRTLAEESQSDPAPILYPLQDEHINDE